MKKIILILFVTFSTLLLSQTKDDVIDFKNINLKLLDSLIFEEAMKERKKEKLNRMFHDEICGEAALYQSEYMSHYNVISHTNDKEFRNVSLRKLGDRFSYFLKNKKTKRIYENKIEILTQFKNINSLNSRGITYHDIINKTYQNYAEVIIKNFMSSPPHKFGILYDLSEYGDMCGEFRTFYNDKTDCLSITGFFVLDYKIGNYVKNK